MKTLTIISILIFLFIAPVSAARFNFNIPIKMLGTNTMENNPESLGIENIKKNIQKLGKHTYKPIIKNDNPEYSDVWKNIITVHLNSSKKAK